MIIADYLLKMSGHIYILYNLICIPSWICLFCYMEKSRLTLKFIRAMEWLGSYSLELYMIHLFSYFALKFNLLQDVSKNILFPISVCIAISICKPIHNLVSNLSAIRIHNFVPPIKISKFK